MEGNNFSSPCIILGNLSSAWLKEATVGGTAFNIVANATWAVEGLFSFSPNIGRGPNFTVVDPNQANANPFDQWLLCGVNGSCTDLSPLAMLKEAGESWGS